MAAVGGWRLVVDGWQSLGAGLKDGPQQKGKNIWVPWDRPAQNTKESVSNFECTHSFPRDHARPAQTDTPKGIRD